MTVVVITDTESNIQKTTENLINAAKNIGLIINKNKTKCMIIFRRERSQNLDNNKKNLSFE